jgi:hypothetical protein
MNQMSEKIEILNLLVPKLWWDGYRVISRRFAKHLPEPEPVGMYDIDVVAKRGETFLIGLSITAADLADAKLVDKIRFLASRKSRYTNQPIRLWLGVDQPHYARLMAIMKTVSEEERKNIKCISVVVSPAPSLFQGSHSLPKQSTTHFV